MTKKELLACIPDAKEMGLTVAPTMLLAMYNDDEEVDEAMVRLFLRVPDEPKEITLYMGEGLSKDIDEALKKWIENNPDCGNSSPTTNDNT